MDEAPGPDQAAFLDGGKVASLLPAATRTLKLLLCNSFRKISRFRIKKVVLTGPNTAANAVLIKPVEFL